MLRAPRIGICVAAWCALLAVVVTDALALQAGPTWAAIQVLSVEDGPCSWAAALAPNVTAKHPVQIEATLPAADSNGTAHLVLTRPNGQQFGCDIEISAKGGTKWKVVQGGSCDISGEGVTMTLSPSAGTIRAADDSLHLDVNGAVTASWGMLSCDGKASIVGP